MTYSRLTYIFCKPAPPAEARRQRAKGERTFERVVSQLAELGHEVKLGEVNWQLQRLAAYLDVDGERICRLEYRREIQGYPERWYLSLDPDWVLREDGYRTRRYPERTDGSIGVEKAVEVLAGWASIKADWRREVQRRRRGK